MCGVPLRAVIDHADVSDGSCRSVMHHEAYGVPCIMCGVWRRVVHHANVVMIHEDMRCVVQKCNGARNVCVDSRQLCNESCRDVCDDSCRRVTHHAVLVMSHAEPYIL